MKRMVISFATLVLFLFLFSLNTVHATPIAPTLTPSDWLTGEINVSWCNVTPGNAIILYTKKWDTANTYTAFDTWTADTACGSHIVQAFENGQSIFYYIVQVDAVDGSISPQSNNYIQTPPVTSYIINWQQIIASMPVPVDNTSLLQQIKDAINGLGNNINSVGDKITQLNTDIMNKIDASFTPSDAAQTNLQNAIDGLKNAVGAGQVVTIGNDLKNAIDSGHNGMVPPVNNDDGTNTFTGGSRPSQLDALDSGTDTPITFRIPLTFDMQRHTIYMKIFTAEQLEKLQWLTVLRKLATYTIWIIFAFWIVTRFTPAFKV